MKKPILFKIFFIILFIAASYTGEFFYRDPLFKNSVKIARAIQKKMPFLIKPLKIYSYLGVLDFFWCFLILLFFPINYCFTFYSNSIFTVHLCNMMKIFYGQGRPFLLFEIFEERDIQKACEAGFGNPSGHSFQSTSNLLGLAQVMIDFFKLKLGTSIIIYIIVAILILLINFSRIILGVHSINQIIFGDTLGFSVYYVIFQVVAPHKRQVAKFFNSFLNKIYHIMNLVLFCVILGYIIITAFLLDKDDQYQELKLKLILYCQAKENQMLTKDSIYKALFVMSYFGMIYGLTLLTNIVKNKYEGKFEEINYYYLNSSQKCFMKYLVRFACVAVCFLPFITTLFKPEIKVVIYYIFMSGVPMFALGFLLFGVSFIPSIFFKMKYITPVIEDVQSDNFIINEDDENMLE